MVHTVVLPNSHVFLGGRAIQVRLPRGQNDGYRDGQRTRVYLRSNVWVRVCFLVVIFFLVIFSLSHFFSFSFFLVLQSFFFSQALRAVPLISSLIL